MNNIRLLAISGSLRALSSHTETLRALALLAPRRVTVSLFDGLAALPPFNPDLDVEGMTPPEPVQRLRDQIEAADGIVICSPEYAHGVPGSLKNALDWLVSAPEVLMKPIALVSASPRSIYAQASLAETLRTMATVLVSEAPFVVPCVRGMEAIAIAADPVLSAPLHDCLDKLVVAGARHRQSLASLPVTDWEVPVATL